MIAHRVLVPALDFQHDLKKAKFFLERLERSSEGEPLDYKKKRLITEASQLLEGLLERLDEQNMTAEVIGEYGKAKLS
jgi:hypothetical protein